MKNNRSGKTAGPEQKNSGSGGRKSPDQVNVRIVCRNFCEYFKGSGGEAECGGFSAVSRATASGVITAAQMERLQRRPPPERIKVLMEKICTACGYRADACDFQSDTPPDGATPCGGYRVFQALLDSGAIREDELEMIPDGVQSPSPFANALRPASGKGSSVQKGNPPDIQGPTSRVKQDK